MERKAWKGRIKPGYEKEYIERHNKIWPELIEVFKVAGICNYTIFISGNELFGYYECEKGVVYAEEINKSKSQVVACWNEYMKDILKIEINPKTGSAPILKQVLGME